MHKAPLLGEACRAAAHMHEYRINPPPPFSLEKTAAMLSPGPDDSIDVFDGKRYTRLLEMDSRMRLALVSSLGAEQRPELIVTLMNGTEQDERPIGRLLTRMLGMNFDLGPFYELCRKDQELYNLSRDLYGLKPPQRLHPFEALALAIASQQAGTHFFRASLAPLADSFSYSVDYAGHTFCAFPSPRILVERTPQDLKCGPLTTQQADFLHGLARVIDDGQLDLKRLQRRPLEDVLETLEQVRGIGLLGAQLTALTGYGRLDCFPTADVALRRWLGRRVYETERADEQQAEEWSSQWGEFSGLVALYIYADLLRNGEI